MHDITEGFKLPKAQAQECMVELAGIGKIALEEGSKVTNAVEEKMLLQKRAVIESVYFQNSKNRIT